MEATLCGSYALFECILSQELLAILFYSTILDGVHGILDVLACLCAIHLFGETEQTIDETLFDEYEIGSQTWLTNQALCLLSLDVFTNLLTHVHDLWILYGALQTFVDVGDEVFGQLASGVQEQYIASNFVAVEVTKSVVYTIVLSVQSNCFNLVNAFALNYFAWLNAIKCRSILVLCLEVVACIVCLHYGGVMTQTVYQTLEEDLLVDSPCWVVCQTILLCIFDCLTNVTTDATCLAKFLYLAIVTALECVDKLGNCLHRRVVAELIHLHLCTVY